MHFPEAALSTFIRVFRSDADVEEILDRLAQTALDAGSVDELELFVFAHWELNLDARVTPAMQAVVLVEEVGLPTKDVATILGMTLEQVVMAVREAWVNDAGLRGAQSATEPAGAEHVEAEAAEPVPIPPPPREGPAVIVEPQRAKIGVKIVAAVLLVGLGALAAIALSQAGYARLVQQGIDPILFLGVAGGFCLLGYALLRAGSKPDGPVERVADAADTGEATELPEQSPATGEHQHEAD